MAPHIYPRTIIPESPLTVCLRFRSYLRPNHHCLLDGTNLCVCAGSSHSANHNSNGHSLSHTSSGSSSNHHNSIPLKDGEPTSMDSVSSLNSGLSTASSERIKDLAVSAVLLDEWLKELSAVAQEQMVQMLQDAPPDSGSVLGNRTREQQVPHRMIT